MKALCTALALVSVLYPAAAGAQEIPCERGPCVKPRPPGTHFLVELHGGGSLNRDGGLAVDGLVGVGGKLRWLPLRFYLITEFAYSTLTEEGQIQSLPLMFRDERSFRDLALGLRTYVPLWRNLRFFVDLMGGATLQAASLERDTLMSRSASGWIPLALGAAGLQVRLFHHLSLGVRAKMVFTRDDLAGLHAAVGRDTPLRAALTAGLTWHF